MALNNDQFQAARKQFQTYEVISSTIPDLDEFNPVLIKTYEQVLSDLKKEICITYSVAIGYEPEGGQNGTKKTIL